MTMHWPVTRYLNASPLTMPRADETVNNTTVQQQPPTTSHNNSNNNPAPAIGMSSIETRRVGFLNWDSDEERERSQKGVAFRRKRKQQKMARRQEEIRMAEEVWNALIDPSNEGAISDFVRNNRAAAGPFFVSFQGLFAAFRRSPLWGRLRKPRGPPYTSRDMLHYLRMSRVSFAELQQADTEQIFLQWLMAIRGTTFRDRFISRPVDSATSPEDSQDNFAGHGQKTAARRRCPRDGNEDPVDRPRRRQRQE